MIRIFKRHLLISLFLASATTQVLAASPKLDIPDQAKGTVANTLPIKNAKVLPIEIIYNEEDLKEHWPDITLDTIKQIALLKEDDVIIAVLDVGVDYNVPGLAWKLARKKDGTILGMDFIDNDNLPSPDYFKDFSDNGQYKLNLHGTEVSLKALQGSEKTKILPMKDKSGNPRIKEAIEFASSNGTSILNFSESTGGFMEGEFQGETEASKAFKEEINSHPDILFIFAAGNRLWHLYPQTYANQSENVINVTTVNKSGELFSFGGDSGSNFSKEDFIVHVAVEVDDAAGERWETSFAAPVVANTAAKIKVLDKNYFTPKIIKEIILETVDKKEALNNKVLSGGVINENRALEKAREILEKSKRE